MPEFDSGSKQLNEPHIPELKYEFCYNMYVCKKIKFTIGICNNS